MISNHSDYQKLRGIVCMSCAVFFFALAGAIVKLALAEYPVNEIAFFRMLFGIIPAALSMRLTQCTKRELTFPRLRGHFLRATTTLACMGLYFASLPYLPLSTAVALEYTEAFFITLLALAFLKERFYLTTLMALIIGFIGVTFISSLTPANTSLLGISLALLSAMFGAVSIIQIKNLSHTENSAAIVFYFTLVATAISACSLLFFWTPPNLRDLGYMLLVGLAAGMGQLTLTVACKNLPASLLAPFNYLGVVWGMVFGYMLWGEKASLQSVIGSLMIIGSALYLSTFGKQVETINKTA